MFSKALFKQSCKANGTMWAIITFAVCFMLACVMLISGGGNIGKVKNSIEDTIIVKEVDSGMKKRAVGYYIYGADGMAKFDQSFAAGAKECLGYLAWLGAGAPEEAKPELKTTAGKTYAETVASNPLMANQTAAVAAAYKAAVKDVEDYINETAKPITEANGETFDMAREYYGATMCAINPDGQMNEYYTANDEEIPETYDVVSIITHIALGNEDEYIASAERQEYREDRTEYSVPIFLAKNMTEESAIEEMISKLSDYKVDRAKYDGFGYTYEHVKDIGAASVITYRGRLKYETEVLAKDFADGKFENEEAYKAAVTAKAEELSSEITSSLLSSLPDEVSTALKEVGEADLYTLVVGSIFYKLAGLLLPIIYMIMASNNLVSGQVDSGSMAYVLSTSTKRKTVVFTQAVYLIGSLFAMFSLTTATGCVCLAIVKTEVELTYGNLLLLNLGAFLVLLALSGLCFFTSCVFDRSKRSMAIGGGLSIFALVAAMLGLFGSPVIPSVVRLDALNYFNYVTIISLFDVVSIIEATGAYIWKFAILAVAGIIGYIAGSYIFTKKDLPL